LRSEPRFLSFEEAVALHAIAVHRDGGATGLIDRGKLDSAIGAPRATFEARLLNETIEEMAASHWHGVCQAHAFLDGNKRVAFLCAFAFLRKNGYDLTLSSKQVESLSLRIAKGKATKSEVARYLVGKIVARL
jgi:death-on-curing protein